MPKTKEKKEEKVYTESDFYEAIKFEEIKNHAILNYLLNKHSHPLPRGLDYVKAFEEIEEYVAYLGEDLYY